MFFVFFLAGKKKQIYQNTIHNLQKTKLKNKIKQQTGMSVCVIPDAHMRALCVCVGDEASG